MMGNEVNTQYKCILTHHEKYLITDTFQNMHINNPMNQIYLPILNHILFYLNLIHFVVNNNRMAFIWIIINIVLSALVLITVNIIEKKYGSYKS